MMHSRKKKGCNSNRNSIDVAQADVQESVDGEMSIPVFVGRFDVSVNADGTFMLPDDLKHILNAGSTIYLVPDSMERCLNLIPKEVMGNEFARIRKQVKSEPRMNEILKTMKQTARKIRIDSHGRVKIPKDLRLLAGIADEAVLVGGIRMIKLWNPNNLDQVARKEEKKWKDFIEVAMKK